MKKRLFALMMASMMVMGAMVGCGGGGSDEPAPTGDGEETQGDAADGNTDMSNVEIGVCIYKFDDSTSRYIGSKN